MSTSHEERRPPANGVRWILLHPDTSAFVSGCGGAVVLAFGVAFAAAGIASAVRSFSLLTLVGLVGIVIAAAGAWELLAAVGPRPRLWVDRTSVGAGETFRVRWETSARFMAPSSIRITWEGCEVAVKQAYNAILHRSAFHTRALTTEIGPLAGTVSVVVPPMPMPSFAGKNARIEWRLRAQVKTRGWPSVTEEHAITVMPSLVEPR